LFFPRTAPPSLSIWESLNFFFYLVLISPSLDQDPTLSILGNIRFHLTIDFRDMKMIMFPFPCFIPYEVLRISLTPGFEIQGVPSVDCRSKPSSPPRPEQDVFPPPTLRLQVSAPARNMQWDPSRCFEPFFFPRQRFSSVAPKQTPRFRVSPDVYWPPP